MNNNIKVVSSTASAIHSSGKFKVYFEALNEIEVGQAIEIPAELCTASIRQQMYQLIHRKGLQDKVAFTMRSSEGPRLNKIA